MTYYVTVDCRRTEQTYPTREAAEWAAIDAIARHDAYGSVSAVWTNLDDPARKQQTDNYHLQRRGSGGRVVIHQDKLAEAARKKEERLAYFD